MLRPAKVEEVHDIVQSLDLKKYIGPKSISIYIPKICKDFFSNTLTKIINISIGTGIFQDLYKLANAVHIHKKRSLRLYKSSPYIDTPSIQ